MYLSILTCQEYNLLVEHVIQKFLLQIIFPLLTNLFFAEFIFDTWMLILMHLEVSAFMICNRTILLIIFTSLYIATSWLSELYIKSRCYFFVSVSIQTFSLQPEVLWNASVNLNINHGSSVVPIHRTMT